ncbi:MAG: hypothetical protein M3138_01740 [Actinomycetota bacterium]|nr:hypothetical protein [Actinomycetota bacterium]
MRWVEFATACPEIADRAAERFRRQELCMLGTLRTDGSPRISPCELDFADGHLILGMMWQSREGAGSAPRSSLCTPYLHHGQDGHRG